jgi:hypothetical protein
MKKLLTFLFITTICGMAHAAKIVATYNNNPITDIDINARVELMKLQKQPTDNIKNRALSNIMNDLAKLEFASNYKITASKTEVNDSVKGLEKQMGMAEGGILQTIPNSADQLNLAATANIVWQKIVMQVYGPQILISDEDKKRELESLSRAQGLPIKITLVRATANKLSNPKSCENAIKIAENENTNPQKFDIEEPDLSAEIRAHIENLGQLKWSAPLNGDIFLICKTEKLPEYKMVETFAENNATFKRAMFDADTQLKNQRRKAMVQINDKNYSGALKL